MIRNLRASLLIPCFNEEDGIERVVTEVPPDVDEVLVMDNRSTDRTAEIARRIGGRVRVEVNPENLGYGGSLRRGLSLATGDVVCASDGDGTYPVGEIPRLVGEMVYRNLDFLSCSRFPLRIGGAMRRRNRLGNWVLTRLLNLLFGLRLADGQSGMWLVRRAAVPRLRLEESGMAFSNEVKIEAFSRSGLRAGETWIPYYERFGETKLYAWSDGVRMVSFMLRRRAAGPRSEPTAPTAGG